MNSARSATLFSRWAPRIFGESHWGAEILPNLTFNGTVSACWKGTQYRRRSQAPLLRHSLRRSFTTSSLFLKAKQSTDQSKGHEGKTQGEKQPAGDSKEESKTKKGVNGSSKESKSPIPGPSPISEFFRREALKLSGSFVPSKDLDPQEEFKRLTEAFRMERNWTGKKPDDNILLHYVGEEERRKRWIRFWESIEAKELRKRFNQAIKGECDSVLSPEGKAQGQAKPEPNSKAKSKKKKAVNEPSKEITTFTGPIPGPPPLGEFFRREALKLSGAFIPRKGVEPQKEFKRLAEAFRIKRNWTGKRADDDFSLRYVEGEELAKRWIRFWKSIEAKDLRKRFHQAVEEEFNWLLSRNKKVMKGMQAWEYLCELFGVGKAPLTRDQAEQVLRPVKVNIYDFIAAERDSLETGTMKLPHRFKNDRELGKYSKQENKIYPLEDAKEDGVLVLLLRRIRQYFDSF